MTQREIDRCGAPFTAMQTPHNRYGCGHFRAEHSGSLTTISGSCSAIGCKCRKFVEPLVKHAEADLRPMRVLDATPTVIAAAIAAFKPGLYRHYKGGLYVAIGLAIHHESRVPMVLYTSCTQGTFNVRPLVGSVNDTDAWADLIPDELGNLFRRFTFVP